MNEEQRSADLNDSVLRMRRVDAACDRFEEDWKVGNRPRIEDYLAATSEPERSELFRELVQLELAMRQTDSQAPPPEEYRSRFPGREGIVDFAFDLISRESLGEVASIQDSNGMKDRPIAMWECPAPTTPSEAQVAKVTKALAKQKKYRDIEPIDSGGRGMIYRAKHGFMGRRVVLKVIRPDLISSESIKRFQQEVEASAVPNHPNIVQAFDADIVGKVIFLVMEYIEGTSLDRLVTPGKPLPYGLACRYMIDAARGLQHAADNKMVHRDIKPKNLMLTNQGEIKILDFGLARIVDDDHTRITHSGIVMGSFDYIAPEQASDAHSAGIQADIYSLGCTLYYLLAGKPPFPDGTDSEKIFSHLFDKPEPLSKCRSDLPEGLLTIIDKMMAKDLGERYHFPHEVMQDLTPFAHPTTAAFRPRPNVPDTAEASIRPDTPPSGVQQPQGIIGIDLHSPAVGRHKPAEPLVKAWPRARVTIPLALACAGLVGFAVHRNLVDRNDATQIILPAVAAAQPIADKSAIELVLIPAGDFSMGSPESDKAGVGYNAVERPPHKVLLNRPFLLGKTEVTRAQYRAVTGGNRGHFMGSDQLPEEQVSWLDAIEFCNQLSAKQRLKHYYDISGTGDERVVTIPDRFGAGYRLPTEAEWEFACRGKQPTPYSFGDAGKLDNFAWYLGNAGDHTHPVGEKSSNPFGLHDMHGSVWEWCWDWYGEKYYGQSPEVFIDPQGPARGTQRVCRGGSWDLGPEYARSAARNKLEPQKLYYNIGFRVARFVDAAR